MSVASELIIESIFAQWTAVSAEACNWSKHREQMSVAFSATNRVFVSYFSPRLRDPLCKRGQRDFKKLSSGRGGAHSVSEDKTGPLHS